MVTPNDAYAYAETWSIDPGAAYWTNYATGTLKRDTTTINGPQDATPTGGTTHANVSFPDFDPTLPSGTYVMTGEHWKLNADCQAVPNYGRHFFDAFKLSVPEVQSVSPSPSYGVTGAFTRIDVYGVGLSGISSAQMSGSYVPVNTHVVNDTHVQVGFDISSRSQASTTPRSVTLKASNPNVVTDNSDPSNPRNTTINTPVSANPFNFYVSDPSPVITAVQQLGPLYPGDPAGAYIVIYGTNFGSGQGTLGFCLQGAPDPCASSDISSSILFWGTNSQGYSQVNAFMTATSTAALGPYDAQLTAATGAIGMSFQAAPGGQTQPQSNRGQVQVTQPGPRITGISPDTIQIGASNVSVTIDGSGFGSSPAVNLPQGFTPAGQGGSDTRIVVLVNVNADAQIGANSVTVTVNNITSNPGTITVKSDVSMKLQVQGPVVISADGKYSEDTTIQVTAVRTDTGATITDFTGTVNLMEVAMASGATIYSQNGGTLPSSVNIASGGTVTFVAKSLAGPKAEGAAGAKPEDAQIKTTNYRVYGGANLAIPQWIISGTTIDSHANGPVYDWVQARTRDIFASATGDVATVLSAVSGYTILAMDSYGSTALTAAAQSAIKINPYFNVHRIDGPDSPLCGYPIVKSFTNTLLHEGRHAYQGAQSAIMGNDDDHDFLVKSIGIAPSTIFLDTTTPRDVCNDIGIVSSRAYHGDSLFDSFGSPDYAGYAIQMDAVVFAASH
jgi:hypothetical protein